MNSSLRHLHGLSDEEIIIIGVMRTDTDTHTHTHTHACMYSEATLTEAITLMVAKYFIEGVEIHSSGVDNHRQ